MKTFYNIDTELFKQTNIAIHHEFVCGSQLLIYQLKNGLRHVANVSGFFYPIVSLEEFIFELRNRGVVTAYLNLHPLLEDSEYLSMADSTSALIIVRDLEEPLSAKQFGKSVRQKLKLATDMTLQSATVDEFEHMYRQQPFYTESGFDDVIARESAAKVWFKLGTERSQSMACIGLGTSNAEYLLAASNKYGRDLQAKVLFEVMIWLQQKGFRYLNLGGGIRAGDGLEKFKKRMGNRNFHKRELKLILDQESFQRHVVENSNGKFPPYFDLVNLKSQTKK